MSQVVVTIAPIIAERTEETLCRWKKMLRLVFARFAEGESSFLRADIIKKNICVLIVRRCVEMKMFACLFAKMLNGFHEHRKGE